MLKRGTYGPNVPTRFLILDFHELQGPRSSLPSATVSLNFKGHVLHVLYVWDGGRKQVNRRKANNSAPSHVIIHENLRSW